MIETDITIEEMEEAIQNDRMCRHFGAAIMKAYPGRRWLVEVLDKGHICYIKIPELSMEYGYAVHLSKTLRSDTKRCVMAAGEILERFNLTRGMTDNNDLISLPSNYKGVIGAEKGELNG